MDWECIKLSLSNCYLLPLFLTGMDQKLSIVLFYFERSLTQNFLNLLMVQTLLLEHGFSQSLDLILILPHQPISQNSTLLDYPRNLAIQFPTSLLTKYILSLCLSRRIIWKRFAHSKFHHHCLSQIPHLHQIISRTTRTL